MLPTNQTGEELQKPQLLMCALVQLLTVCSVCAGVYGEGEEKKVRPPHDSSWQPMFGTITYDPRDDKAKAQTYLISVELVIQNI